MSAIKNYILPVLLFILSTSLFSQTKVEAHIDATQYKVGDIIEVDVKVANNPGLHGLFFDLYYDSKVLEFDSLKESSLFRNIFQDNSLLYSLADDKSAGLKGGHLIVSYVLKKQGELTTSQGSLVTLKFRVKGQEPGNKTYKFSFKNCELLDEKEIVLTASWTDSSLFTIKSPYEGSFIMLKEPYANQVFYKDSAPVKILCSEGPFKVSLKNSSITGAAAKISEVTKGYFEDTVQLQPGFNIIEASLSDNTGAILSTDSVRIYKSGDDRFVKIISPKDRQLLNTDYVTVEVDSSYPVEINGIPAKLSYDKVYSGKVWLVNGFNTITAIAKSPENVIYKDTIKVYYKKDSSIFSFVSPANEEIIKPRNGQLSLIKGEIDSMYSTSPDPMTGGAILNQVTIYVTYKNSRTNSSIPLVSGEKAFIKESDYSYGLPRSKYMFQYNFNKELTGLEGGELLIEAYKNREGNAWDDKISRIVYLDDNRLSINLIRPNLFTSDLLDSALKIRGFNEGQDPAASAGMSPLKLSNEGGLMLTADGGAAISLEKDSNNINLTDVDDLIESPAGDLYALVNGVGSKMEIYKKSFGKTAWSSILKMEMMHGYQLCYTAQGILVGVSNLNSGGESGLYLLKESEDPKEKGYKFYNINFSNSALSHVQFIKNDRGTIYLYGNFYNHLYHFDIHRMTENNGNMLVNELGKVAFQNSFNLNSFTLSRDLSLAILQTGSGELYFYRKEGAAYVKHHFTASEVKSTEGLNSDHIVGDYLVSGEYSVGDYNSYLIIKKEISGDSSAIVVMEHKNSGYLITKKIASIAVDWLKEVDPVSGTYKDAVLMGLSFRDDSFTFIYKTASGYYRQDGAIFFENFYKEGETLSYPYSGTLDETGYRLFTTKSGELYSGLNSPASSRLYSFHESYTKAGEARFNYLNENVEGLTGFRFYVDPVWLESGTAAELVQLGFTLRKKVAASDQLIFNQPKVALKDFINVKNSNFVITNRYDTDMGKQEIHILFTEIQKEKSYINFDITLQPLANRRSPALYNLEIFKKIVPKICKEPGVDAVLPLQGYIYDRTVKVVNINGRELRLGRDGSFYYDLPLDEDGRTIAVNIYCRNRAGEEAKLNFNVLVAASYNGIANLTFKGAKGDLGKALPEKHETYGDTVLLSGNYYGLIGAHVGYELYGYEHKKGVKSEVLLKQGLFKNVDTTTDLTSYPGTTNAAIAGKTGYEAGSFTDETIDLTPGSQLIKIYCENPGGKRSYYKVNGKMPEIDFKIAKADQKIVFNNYQIEDLTTDSTPKGLNINKQLLLECYESGSGPYKFKAQYEISGYVHSELKFSDLKARSYTTGLTFAEGKSEMTIPVRAGNSFRFTIFIEMGEPAEKDFDFVLIPTTPSLAKMEQGVRVKAVKSLKDTNFIPDFSPLDPVGWTNEERESLKVPLRFRLNRSDLPLLHGKSRMVALLNYKDLIQGFIKESSEKGLYYLEDSSNNIVYLEGIKEGVNRLSWELKYENSRSGQVTISSSSQRREGMEDYLFTYHDDSVYQKTAVTFSKALHNRYYKAGSLPTLNISKDSTTKLEVTLNGLPLKEKSGGTELAKSYSLEQSGITREGKNSLLVKYSERRKEVATLQYEFLFDSRNPLVEIASYSFTPDYTTLESLTVNVKEANFSRARLHYLEEGREKISSLLPQVIIRGRDSYELRWDNLSSANIRPTTLAKFWVRAYDLAGQAGDSLKKEGFKDVTRPGAVGVEEKNIILPIYKGIPSLTNEASFNTKLFSGHTKFAPEKFLRRESVKEMLELDEGTIISNKVEEKLVGDGSITGDDFGRSVSICGNYAIVGAEDDDEKGMGSGSAFIYYRVGNSWKEIAKLVPGDGALYDHFGWSVSINGDYAIIGAKEDDDKGESSGSVYFYKRVGNSWEQMSKIVATDGAAGDYFGGSVSISGDYAVVGASFDDDKGESSGSVYFYKRVGNSWEQMSKIVPTDGAAGDIFGHSVSISGDYSVVGASFDDDKGESSGSVYFYRRVGNNWEKMSKIVAFDGAPDDWFGRSVSISGDYAFIASELDDGIGQNSGSVYIYKRVGNNWEYVRKIVADGGIAGDKFARGLSISGDYAAISGKYGQTGVLPGTSFVNIYRLEGNSWKKVDKIIATHREDSTFFGHSVSISGDYVIIGDLGGYRKKNQSDGVSYIYNLNIHQKKNIDIPTWKLNRKVQVKERVQTKLFTGTTGKMPDKPGRSVSISGDYAIVGAEGDFGVGAPVYVYKKNNNGWQLASELSEVNGATDLFGRSLSISGDYAIVGAPHSDDKGADSGLAYIYKREGDNWQKMCKLLASDGAAQDKFGYSVSINGNFAIVSAINDDDKGENSGSAYIFERVGSSWKQVSKLTAADGASGDNFGKYLSISGQYALIGVPNDDDKGQDSGSAYIFERVGSSWQQMSKLTAADGELHDGFGRAVSINKNYAVIGAPCDDDRGFDSGSAYIFERVGSSWQQVRKLADNNGTPHNYFGSYISANVEHIVIGDRAGSVFIYKNLGSNWQQFKKLRIGDGTAPASALSLSGDQIIVGVRSDKSLLMEGNAYCYDLNAVRELKMLEVGPLPAPLWEENRSRYLVFKYAKDYRKGLDRAEALKDQISFEITGKEYNYKTRVEQSLPDLKSGVPNPLSLKLDTNSVKLADDGEFLYYIFDYNALKKFVSDTLNSPTDLLGFQALIDKNRQPPVVSDWKITDRGSLSIVYKGILKDITPDEIYITGNDNHTLEDIIFYDRAYEGERSVDHINLHSGLKIPFTERKVSFDNTTDERSLAFWFRQEDRDLKDSKKLKTLLTFTDHTSDFINLGYRRNKLELQYSSNGQPLSATTGYTIIPGIEGWNHLTLIISKKSKQLKLYLDNVPLAPINLNDSDLSRLLGHQSGLYFGPKRSPDRSKGEEFNSGFFSIASPLYIDKALMPEDIDRLFKLKDRAAPGESRYNMNSSTDQVGPANNQLKFSGGSDYYTKLENADYTVSGGGSLKLSSSHKNYLTLKPIAPGNWTGSQVILDGAGSAVTYDVKQVYQDPNGFGIIPKPGMRGRYYFGDKNSSYGLGTDRWYSLSGFVSGLKDGGDSELVISLNGKEQRYKLRKGPFHFVYENSSMEAPLNLKIYVDTDGWISFRNDMCFNEGNYSLPYLTEREGTQIASSFKERMPGSITTTSAKTGYILGRAGTIEFWYKPFIANKEGSLNYGVELFDSSYLKIGAKIEEGDGEARFYATFKNKSGPNLDLTTDIKVSHSWQHLQLSYDCDHNVAYLYIDGRVAAKRELGQGGKLPEFDLAGATKNNITLGSDLAGTRYAEGFIDELVISKYYRPSQYRDNRPLKVEHYQDKNGDGKVIYEELRLTPILSGIGNNLEGNYSLSPYEGGDFSYNFSDGTTGLFPISLAGREGGRYRLAANLKINGYNYKEILTANVVSRPKFSLRDWQPIIFSGEQSDIWFKLRYDRSYLLESKELRYAGAALRISGSFGVKTIYLVQDFKNRDLNSWLVGEAAADLRQVKWTPLKAGSDGLLNPLFKGITTSSEVAYELKTFYFLTAPGVEQEFDKLAAGLTKGKIPLASLNYEIVRGSTDGPEYKLVVDSAKGAASSQDSRENRIFEEMTVEYAVLKSDNRPGTLPLKKSGTVALKRTGQAELYYDDILPAFGDYNCTLKLKYRGVYYAVKEGIKLSWKQNKREERVIGVKELRIDELSLLNLDKELDLASLYLKYTANGIGTIAASLKVIQNGKLFYEKRADLSDAFSSSFFNKVKLPEGRASIVVELKATNFFTSREIEINNSVSAPEIVLTNSVDSLISYNNLFFSWKGVVDGKYRSDIRFRYRLDDRAYTSFDKRWRSLRLYNLSEGQHRFTVEAEYKGVRSAPRVVPFFIDVSKPLFNSDKIKVQKLYDRHGVFDRIKITGAEGAIKDISLSRILVDKRSVTVGKGGSFVSHEIPITGDGLNRVKITAYDRVGNYSDHEVVIDNSLTTIIYPQGKVKYSPMTVVGRLSRTINKPVSIYLFDPFSTERGEGDYSGWKKAKINEDRTFFIEDVHVNPGTDVQELVTTLKLATVFESGAAFERELEVKANEILMPIELKLSTHAAEGENADTYVKIDCKANLSGISSWSIDFDGDGIYDMVELVDNPLSISSQSQSWEHKYSSLGLVKPRVRVITTEGQFFSVSETLIIHEKIKQASHKMVEGAIALSSLYMPDRSNRLFVLKEETAAAGKSYLIEVYEVGRNKGYISELLYKIDLTGLGIDNPVKIGAYGKDHLFIAANNGGKGAIYELIANRFGNYEISSNGAITLEDEIRDITFDRFNLYVSLLNSESFIKIPVGRAPASVKVNSEGYRFLEMVDNSADKNYLLNLYSDPEMTLPAGTEPEKLNKISYLMVESGYILEAGRVLDSSRKKPFTPELHRTVPLGMGAGLAKDEMGLLIADYYNNRVVRLSGGLKVNEQFGSFGTGEKEFLKPALIKSYENRIFVFDEGRRDIQVFDLNFKPVCTLKFSSEPGYHNYLAPDFFKQIADIEVIAKEEGGKLYYYALILSRSKGKLAMLRLPQWEELRARVRNNKIVFLQDGELYTAKPDGGDLAKVLTTDSIPRIEGTIDYPALSPDGKSLVFTSRVELYNGQAGGSSGGDIHAYDNLYVVDIESNKLNRIDLGLVEGFEIERPVFNSNGDKIIFSAKRDGLRWQIYTYDFKSALIEKLFSSDEDARYPYYSPDDRFVVFTTNYDGDEEIEIIDTENITMRVTVSSNGARDSLPVWSRIYPHEITDPKLKIESKIAFVSERDFHKGVYYLYLSRKSDSDIRVVKKDGTDVGNSPDSAAIEVTSAAVEGDYPCFTGDGRSLVFEHFDGKLARLKRFSFDVTDPLKQLTTMELPGSAKKPAGMKNMVANFSAENRNGDEIELKWNRYTKSDIFYKVRFRQNKDKEPFVEKKIFSQTGTTLKGLEMGMEYLVKVCIVENGEEVATSQWEKVVMPEVVARPSFEIDKDNPYLVRLHGWKPDPKKLWKYVWRVDNSDYSADYSRDFSYEFGTSGTKSISLKVSNDTGKVTNISAPMQVEIVSDIEPIIEHRVADDNSTVELSALNSKGKNINFAAAEWIITGHGKAGQTVLTGPKVTADLSGYSRRITVMLRLNRKMVNGQNATDSLEKTMDIDLDLKEIRPVILYRADEKQSRLFTFSGERSIGNVDWYRAKWAIYADGRLIHREDGVSSFSYSFPERNRETLYSVSLTLPNRNNGSTTTVSQIISVEAEPIRPHIDYRVVTIKDGANVIGSKILFDCTKSRGSGIDFAQARWTIPTADKYQEQPTRFGPTVTYNLAKINEGAVIEVTLSLFRKDGTVPVTLTEMVKIGKNEVPPGRVVVNKAVEESTDGKVLYLDILKSTGPNIDWERTEWLIDGNYSRKGPSVRLDLPASSSKRKVNYQCSLYRYGGGAPEVVKGVVELDKTVIKPLITYRRLSGSRKNVYELSLLETEGVNIDWERSDWYIHDGHENVVRKRGGRIVHAFNTKSKSMGYPIVAEIYLKGESYPFTAYTTIDVEGDELLPIIKWDTEGTDPNVITFSAAASKGAGIDWSQAKWTFGDSSEYQYGSTVVHKYPLSQSGKSYRVSLTLSRKSINGTTEVKTVFKNITIGSDRIRPIIKVLEKRGDYLVLSAESSEGRGLMLDRSQWLFEGAGDNLSHGGNSQTGISTNSSFSTNMGMSVSTGFSGGFFGGPSGSFGFNYGLSASTSVGGNLNFGKNNTFSSSNSHTGAVCRRYLRNQDGFKVKSIVVTLFVYRLSPEGTMVGESLTYNINLGSVKAGDELGR